MGCCQLKGLGYLLGYLLCYHCVVIVEIAVAALVAVKKTIQKSQTI